MRTYTLILAALLAGSQDNPPADNKVKDLQKERVTVLTELVEQANTGFRTGRSSYEEVLEAQVQLLNARLDLAEKAADRVALYEGTVAVLKSYEEVAKGRVESGRGTAAAALRIRARRLEVEIRLEQAKIREAKGR
jgi:outer membrane protein TolC